MTCEHAPSANPRKAGWCVKCGKALPRRADRDIAAECAMTKEIATVDVTALNRMATERAAQGALNYGTGAPELSRDLERDALEELADCRNYLVWRLDQIQRGIRDDMLWAVPNLQLALRSTAIAFDALDGLR